MTDPNNRLTDTLLLTSCTEQQRAVERFIEKQLEENVPLSPQQAFEEFVEDHAELLRRLAL